MRHDIFSGATLVVLLAVCRRSVSAHDDTAASPEVSLFNGTMYAACKMRPTASLADGLPKVYGHVLFKQDYPDGKLKVHLRLHGFPKDGPSQPRAVHIHQYGDVHGGCGATGGHFNPHDVNHPNHPGDFGNFTPKEGKINATFASDGTLFGPTSVIGRAVVVHESADDLGRGGNTGSLLHGNAGQRLGCCVIGISSPKHWNTSNKYMRRK